MAIWMHIKNGRNEKIFCCSKIEKEYSDISGSVSICFYDDNAAPPISMYDSRKYDTDAMFNDILNGFARGSEYIYIDVDTRRTGRGDNG